MEYEEFEHTTSQHHNNRSHEEWRKTEKSIFGVESAISLQPFIYGPHGPLTPPAQQTWKKNNI